MVFALACVCLALPRGADRVAPIWLPNAFLLTLLLTSSKRAWPHLLLAGGAAFLVANMVMGDAPPLAAGLAVANTAESALGALLAVHWIGRKPDIGQPRHLACYAASVAIASLLSCAMAFLILDLAGRAPQASSAVSWAVADFAGLVIVTPCLLVLWMSRRTWPEITLGQLWPLALLVGLTSVSFLQNRFALAYLVVAGLVLVTGRLGLLGAAAGVLATLVIASTATLFNLGPFALGSGSVAESVVALQVFLGVCFYVSVPIALQRRRAGELSAAAQAAFDEAREAEARYRLIAERANDLIVRVDASGRLIYVSPSCRRVGYEPEDLVGVDAAALVHLEDAARHRQTLQRLFAGEPQPSHERQHRFRRKDGEYIWLEGNPVLLNGASGAPAEILNVLRDVTERKALEQELTTAREQAEAAAEVKSEFLANMSHELRTPLTSVLGYTKLALQQPELSAATRTYVQRVSDASGALLSTVNDILDFSKLEAGQLSFHPEPTPLLPLLRSALSLFEPQAADKGLELRLHCASGETLALMIDPNRLRQVLLNLIGNAVKFTQSGGITLLARYDEAAQMLHIEVEDTGAGVAPAALHRLFQRFSQVDGALTRSHGGTGLGLAICKGIVEASGGKIAVRSEQGRGSCFFFSMPASVALAPMAGKAPHADADLSIRGVRILVVDDHAVNRKMCGLILAGLSAEVSQAADGEEAVKLASHAPFDAILMDLRMPKLDGQAALAQIRSRPGPNDATPILAFTADAGSAVEARLLECGFDGVVAKPVSPEAMVAKILKALTCAAVEAEIIHGVG